MDTKLLIDENTATEQLRKLAVFLGGDFIESYGSAKCILNNSKGKGYINSYDLIPGLAVRTFNITFNEEIRFSKDESNLNPLYFLYSLKGYYFHQFGNIDQPKKMEEKQNVILKSGPTVTNEIILPSNTHIQLSVIFLTREKIIEPVSKKRPLEASLKDIFGFIDESKPYRYLGEIDLNTAQHAKILIENKRTDIIGRMITEGAVMNTIAQQVLSFEKNTVKEYTILPLTKEELSKIAGVADYIEKNIAETITVPVIEKYLGLSSKKIQKGVKHLFGQTFHQFLQSVRLEHAKKLLVTTDLSISEICYKIGLVSRSHFSKTFNDRFGVVPSSYRSFLLSDNSLFELSYRSIETSNFSDLELQELVDKARIFNKSKNISGCLIHHEGVFFQILEGPKLDVLALYKKIQEDNRHSDIELLWKGPKASRIFEEWSMALVSERGMIEIPLQGQGSSKNIDIKKLSGELNEPSIASEMLWRSVRNIIKISI